jgi:hypothetical protein
MDGELSEWLPLWILAPIVLLVVILLAGFQLPSSNCDGEGAPGGMGQVLFVGFVGLSILVTAGAGLVQLVSRARSGRFGALDAAVLVGAALLVLVVAETVVSGRSGAGERLLIAGLILAPLSLPALSVLALVGKSRETAGALLPVYLFGAAWWYYVAGASTVAISDGAFC